MAEEANKETSQHRRGDQGRGPQGLACSDSVRDSVAGCPELGTVWSGEGVSGRGMGPWATLPITTTTITPSAPPPSASPWSPTLCVVDDAGSHVTSPKGGIGCEADLIAVGHTEISQEVLQQLPLLHAPHGDGFDHGIVLVQL